MKHHFTKVNGRVTNPQVIQHLPDGYYEISKKNKRSLQQNKYYWSCVVAMIHEGLRDMGNDVSLQETHEFLKHRFNSKEIVNTLIGEVHSVPMSTTALNKEDFAAYIEKIQQFAAEYLNINIPNPGEQVAFEYE
jgi:hypothetical protein